MKKTHIFLVLLLIVSIGSVIAIDAKSQSRSSNDVTWLWHTQEIEKDPHNIIAFLAKNKIEDLYLQIDYDLDVNSYKEFIGLANEKGISVHALGGAPDWIKNKGIEKQHVFFSWLESFQNQVLENQRFKGIHLDIEPYLDERYESDRNGTLKAYQDCLNNALLESENLGLALAIDIPFWFDELEYDTEYGQGIVAEWVISRIESVVIMAYRDKAQGNNGIIDLVSKEMELAEAYKATIIVAVETEYAEEGDFISFYEEGKRRMNKELKHVYTHYGQSSSFGGFGIHNLVSWMRM